MNGLRLGEADPRDPAVAALLATHHQMSRRHYAVDDCHALSPQEMADSGIALHGAWFGRELVAVGGIKPLGDGRVELKSMHTAQAARGKGVARALLEHLMAAARQSGQRVVLLEAGRSDAYAAPARALYRSAGFRECPPFGDYVEREASVFMERSL